MLQDACKISLFTQHSPNPTSLTSTESIFPKANNKGCMLRSGSLRKQLGFAWCWKCQWFHQLAGAPCNTRQIQEASSDIYFLIRQSKIWVQRAQLFLSSNAMTWLRAKPIFMKLTFKCPITNLWIQWFHLDLPKTERCPKSCCSQPAWAWKTLP